MTKSFALWRIAILPIALVIAAALALAATALLSGCNQQTARLLTDRGGNTVAIKGQPKRIISTAPSSTEIIVDLGLADRLVAIDKYSLDIEGVSQDLTLIDFFFPDAEAILGINPDVIISNGHNNLGTGEDPFKLIREAGVPVVYIPLSPDVAGICADIEFIADLLGVPDKGREVVASLRGQFDEIAAIGRGIEHKKKAFFEISPVPELVSVGRNTYLHEMMVTIGCENIFADQIGVIFPSGEAILDRNPDLIFTCVQADSDPVVEILGREGFAHVAAIENRGVYRVDTNSASRPSARILLALKQMAKAAYPDIYAELQ